jgi:methionyl-tRNA formyltransferase
MKRKIAFAGSSIYSQTILETLSKSDFEISYVLVPAPRPCGRKKILTDCPVALYCQENKIQYFYVDKKIKEVKEKIISLDLDLFLVMDFGYFIPEWLINLPKFKALNIHPSLLPEWRGSSPGQFSLLFGQKESAVTLMKINKKMDQGDLVEQIKFEIKDNYYQDDYYKLAFSLIKKELVGFLENYMMGKIDLIRQSANSSFPLARMLKKEDSYLDFEILKKAISSKNSSIDEDFYQKSMEKIITKNANKNIEDPILMFLLSNTKEDLHKKIIYQAFKAFYQWPGIWTKIPTNKGLKIMKIIELSMVEGNLILNKVKIEGKNEANFNEIKNQIVW